MFVCVFVCTLTLRNLTADRRTDQTRPDLTRPDQTRPDTDRQRQTETPDRDRQRETETDKDNRIGKPGNDVALGRLIDARGVVTGRGVVLVALKTTADVTMEVFGCSYVCAYPVLVTRASTSQVMCVTSLPRLRAARTARRVMRVFDCPEDVSVVMESGAKTKATTLGPAKLISRPRGPHPCSSLAP